MNDVAVYASGDQMRVDMKLEGYTVTVKLQGETLEGYSTQCLTVYM